VVVGGAAEVAPLQEQVGRQVQSEMSAEQATRKEGR
jgi:hypothetical protein